MNKIKDFFNSETLKKYFKMLRPYDFILVIALTLLSFLPAFIFWVAEASEADTTDNNVYAVISINGEEVDRFLLTGNEEHQLITYHPAPDKYNIVEIDGERIRNKEDNSPQQIAVQRDWIQNPGETSINIPHRLLIEIISESGDDEPDDSDDSEVDIVP